jgi:hypothetical protein
MDRAVGPSTARHSISSILRTSISREGVLSCDGIDRAIHLGDDLEGVSEFVSAAQLVVTVAMYVLAIVRIQKRDVPAHMRYMICIALFLLPAGLSRILGYWFSVGQVTSQTISLAVIEPCLAVLIAFDVRQHLNARPFVVAFLAYNTTAVVWIALGRLV